MRKTFDIEYEEIPTKVPDNYRLDGKIGRKYCASMFPVGFSISEAMKIIRLKLGIFPEGFI